MTRKEKAVENIVAKGGNTCNQHFVLFPEFFLALTKTSFDFSFKFIFFVCKCFSLDQSKILSLGKELIMFYGKKGEFNASAKKTHVCDCSLYRRTRFDTCEFYACPKNRLLLDLIGYNV